jgi:serine/threonine protein phosphatase 1
MPRTIAIGDIHGCAAALAAILAAIQPREDDTIVTLGDYIDRGPDSKAVVEQLLALEARCRLVALLGNHEVMLLAVRAGQIPPAFWINGCGGAATLASYGGNLEDVPGEHWQFFRTCERFYETDTHLFLHANYDPERELADQPDDLLFWTHLHQAPARHKSGKIAVVGHTPQLSGEIFDLGHLVCIDTWCFGHGTLTALDVETRQVWQAEKGGVLLRNGT